MINELDKIGVGKRIKAFWSGFEYIIKSINLDKKKKITSLNCESENSNFTLQSSDFDKFVII